jgi:hypothetical protein
MQTMLCRSKNSPISAADFIIFAIVCGSFVAQLLYVAPLNKYVDSQPSASEMAVNSKERNHD